MNYTTRILLTSFDSTLRRVVKVLRLGSSDAKTAKEILPFGFDSNPLKNMVAIYAETSSKGGNVIIGYLNINQLAQIGESRMFSTDAQGNLKTWIWLHTDGSIELAGKANHLAQFEGLQKAFNQLLSDFNAHVHTANNTPIATPSTADISTAEIIQLKCP